MIETDGRIRVITAVTDPVDVIDFSDDLGSRVLYPALARSAGKEIVYDSAFGAFFAALPPIGNYAHTRLLVYDKRARK